jgi:hypothetical protein
MSLKMTTPIDKSWRNQKVTEKQLWFINVLFDQIGFSFDETGIPETRGEASILIMQLRKLVYGKDLYEENIYPHVPMVCIDENGVPLDPQPPKHEKPEYFSKKELISLGLRKPNPVKTKTKNQTKRSQQKKPKKSE